ncbi:MAG: aldolase/citrate lyase family protein [Pseudomonadota bacterium]
MSFKERLAAREPMVGTFLKTPSPIICEVLGRSDLDAVCIDAEHAPFDRGDIDSCIHALSAVGLPSLVRVPANRAEYVLNALDCGATGVLVPHIRTADEAASLVANAHYGTGRGYAGSSRAAHYGGRTMSEHKEKSAASTVVIGQIEDAEALDHIDGLLAINDMDAYFIGRADLSVSLGAAGPNDKQVLDAVEMICRKGDEANVTIGMFTSNLDEIPKWRSLGASLFLLGSDHGFMLAGAGDLTSKVRNGF